MRISELLSIIDSISPFKIAQSWDNVGLLIGDKNCKLTFAMMTVDVTESVVDEAISAGCNTIISYHPVIWEPLKRITADEKKPVVYRLLREGINVISVHTALDAANGGVNDKLAEAVGLVDAEPLSDFVNTSDEMYKLVVFVPLDAVNSLSKAVFDAGAGRLGNYSDCGFKAQGEGSFLPLDGANPAIGTSGKLEKVQEYRFETLVSGKKLPQVINAMKTAHPYEMPAYDIIKLELYQEKYGIGRFGKLAKKRQINDIIADIKKLTGVRTIGFIGSKKGFIGNAAVCAGSCGKIINTVIACGCELYITGELKHHDALIAKESGLLCMCLGHSVSERFILKQLANQIRAVGVNTKLIISKKDTDPFTWKQV